MWSMNLVLVHPYFRSKQWNRLEVCVWVYMKRRKGVLSLCVFVYLRTLCNNQTFSVHILFNFKLRTPVFVWLVFAMFLFFFFNFNFFSLISVVLWKKICKIMKRKFIKLSPFSFLYIHLLVFYSQWIFSLAFSISKSCNLLQLFCHSSNHSLRFNDTFSSLKCDCF